MLRTRSIVILSLVALALVGAACAPSTGAAPTAAPNNPPSGATVEGTRAPANTTPPGAEAVGGASGPSAEGDLIKLVVVPDKSKANYRVREQLASLSLPSDAVGATSAITGTIVGKPDGSIVSAESKFVVDLSTLKSDRSMRDNFLRQNVLQTSRYPTATFVPTSASGLPAALPASNQGSFKLVGDLTIRDVTKQVTWDATCQVQGNTQATCHATTSFPFEFFNLEQPRVPVVLSVVNNITLEVDLTLQRVGS